MKKIELNQLQTEALIVGKEAFYLQQNGKLLGYFYPVSDHNKAEFDALWKRLDKAVERVMAETGLDE